MLNGIALNSYCEFNMHTYNYINHQTYENIQQIALIQMYPLLGSQGHLVLNGK